MPATAEFERNYYSVAYAELDSIPKKEGNVIATYDTDAFYYDVGNPAGSGQNITRRKANGIEFVDELPPDDPSEIDPTKTYAREEPTTIFVISNGNITDEEDNPIVYYSGYRWNSDRTPAGFDEVFNNLRDFHVLSQVKNSTKAYLVGSEDSTDIVGTLIKNTNIYLTTTGKIHANIEGTADVASEANHAAEATLATKAINDNASTPKPITNYLYGIQSSYTGNQGTALTLTKGDGTSTVIRTADTQYSVYGASTSGLVPGTNTTVVSDNSNLVLSGDGWINKNNLDLTAEKANKDSDGNVITTTYYANASLSGHDLTLTKGDGITSQTITLPDTTYSVFTTSTDGLAPKANGSGDNVKFLRGDATWQTAITPSDVYVGATSSTAGTAGLVPAAAAGYESKYLRGDGTWQDTPLCPNYQGATSLAPGVAGLVPPAAAGETAKYMRGDGTWNGTFAQGVDGLVPGPSTVSASLSLKANGQWTADVDTLNTAGATNSTSKLFIVGATAQNDGIITNSNEYVYKNTDGKLYQTNDAGTGSVQVVDLTSAQILENKQFVISGSTYSLGTASTKAAAETTLIQDNDTVPTGTAVANYVSTRLAPVQQNIATRVSNTVVAPIYDNSASYTKDTYVMYDDGNGAVLYKCIQASTGNVPTDTTYWVPATIMGITLVGTLTAGSTSITFNDASITANSHIEVWAENGNVNYTNISSIAGSVTITFLAQASNMTVEVRVS